MVVTDAAKSALHLKYLTTQAKDDDVYHIHNEVGYNYRMTNLQAALGMAQIENLVEFIQIKRNNFELYGKALGGHRGLSFIDEPGYGYSNHWFYALMVDRESYGMSRDGLMKKLSNNNIQSRPLWYLTHLQKPYKDCQAYKIEKAHWYYDRLLNLPCSVNLTDDEISKIIYTIRG
jgi:perosamine synthetase